MKDEVPTDAEGLVGRIRTLEIQNNAMWTKIQSVEATIRRLENAVRELSAKKDKP